MAAHLSLPGSTRTGSSSGVLLGLIGVIALLIILFFIGRQEVLPAGGITLYYGEGCPHCLNVEEFLKVNNVDQKVSFERKEVWSDRQNAREMAAMARICSLPTDNIGVPFLWTGSGCLTGDQDIIDFFQKKL